MYGSALMAFVHHLAAFTLVASLAVEVAMFKPPLSMLQAQRLQRTDMLFGAAATVVLVGGMLRAAFFETGPASYWHDTYFLIKFAAFVLAALISIYPTMIFLSWNRSLKAGTPPDVPLVRMRRGRVCPMVALPAVRLIAL